MNMKLKFILIILLSILFSIATSGMTYAMMIFLEHPNIVDFYILIFSLIAVAILIPIRTLIVNLSCIQLTQEQKCKIVTSVTNKRMLYLESSNYKDSLNQLKNSLLQNQKFLSALSVISVAVGNTIAFYFFLFNELSVQAIVNVLISLGLAVGAFIVNYKNSLLMYDFWQKYINNTRRYNYFADILTKGKYVVEKKVFGYKSFFEEIFGLEFDKATKENKVLGKRRIILEFFIDLIFTIFIFSQILVLTIYYYFGYVSLAFIVAMIPFSVVTFNSMCSAFSAISDLMQVKVFYKNMQIFLEKELESETDKNAKCEKDIAVCLDKISFTYPNHNIPVIKELSFTLQKGKKYAIVGVNGSGKTTLVKIIGGLYRPESGRVYCHCKPTILFQDFNRYPLTVEENISLSQQADYDKIMEVLDKVGIIEKVQKLPKCEKTKLTRLKEDGIELSGGEWQRLALARILYKKSEIIILDEPTASLDPLVEVEIYNQYMKLLDEQTVIFVTHRLGYLRAVDEILVLNEGRIVERGTHEELISSNDSLYYNMYQEQRSIYQDEK